jgi:hypothetical protein
VTSVSIAEQFVLLEADGRSASGEGVKARDIGMETSAGPVLIALDASGSRHLLLPAGEEVVHADRRSRGVAIAERTLQLTQEAVRFVDVACLDRSLALVFERLVEDVLARFAAGENPVRAAQNTLEQWRELLRTSTERLDAATVLGLVGELEVLERLGRTDASAALRAWRGPRRTVHDFVSGDSAIEVKATASVDGNMVSISNVDQLDPSLVGNLHLAVVHCRVSEIAPSLDDRIRRLLKQGFHRADLLDAVAKGGYVFESGQADDRRYEVRSLRVWRVHAEFPGIRRGDVAAERQKGVSHIRYDLALDAAPPRLTDATANALLDGWTRGDG